MGEHTTLGIINKYLSLARSSFKLRHIATMT